MCGNRIYKNVTLKQFCYYQTMGVPVLHIKSEIECQAILFDEKIGIAQPDKHFSID